jgi:hypothetical protein
MKTDLGDLFHHLFLFGRCRFQGLQIIQEQGLSPDRWKSMGRSNGGSNKAVIHAACWVECCAQSNQPACGAISSEALPVIISSTWNQSGHVLKDEEAWEGICFLLLAVPSSKPGRISKISPQVMLPAPEMLPTSLLASIPAQLT